MPKQAAALSLHITTITASSITVEEDPIIAPYARPEKSEAQLRELALKVELTKNKTLGPGRHRRFGGIHQWEGVRARRPSFTRVASTAFHPVARAGALPRV